FGPIAEIPAACSGRALAQLSSFAAEPYRGRQADRACARGRLAPVRAPGGGRVTDQLEFVREQGLWAKEDAHDQRQRSRENGTGSFGQRYHFQLVRFGQVKLDNRRRYVVKNLIPHGGLIVVWGPPKCGKSFWVSDLALHVALGWEYRGRRVEAGV